MTSVLITLRRLLLLAGMLAMQSCATSGVLEAARDQFRHGSPDDALQTLAEADISKRDRLLLYLDRGLVAQANGRYTDSIDALERAVEIVDELDYFSVSEQSTAVIINDRATSYRGEYSERLWIHTFQMLNFLMLGNPEAAAVEARRAVAVFDKHGGVLHDDVFTRVLMGMSFEAAGQYDSATVEYRRLNTDFDLPTLQPLTRKQSELTLLVASGFMPGKLPGDLFIDYDARISFPYYAESLAYEPTVNITPPLAHQQYTTILQDIARQSLDKRGKIIATRQALRLGAKHAISEAIEESDEIAGGVARLLLLAIEQADTRGWETLPATLSVIRIPLEPGQHSLSVDINAAGEFFAGIERVQLPDISISPGERQFMLIRTGINSSELVDIN